MTDDYLASVAKTLESRELRLRSASGWLTLVGKVFLAPGVTVIGAKAGAEARLPPGAPNEVGQLRLEDGVVHFTRSGEAVVKLGADEVEERRLRSDRDGPADSLHVLDASGAVAFVLEIMERGSTFALRIRDVRVVPAPFAGIDRFPVARGWRKSARFERYPEPRRVEIDFDDLAPHAGAAVTSGFTSPGVVVFDHEGAEHRLEALYEDASQRRLFILFRDATAGAESYGLGRLVYAPLADAEGRVDLDFNLALLPACAFTIFATCPIPPKDNRLAIAIRAGERSYRGVANGA